MTSTTRRQFCAVTGVAGAASLAGLGTAVAGGLLAPSAAKAETNADSREPLPASIVFREAVGRGDLEAVHRLLKLDPALAWSKDETGRSAFLIARMADQLEVMTALQEAGVRLDVVEAASIADWDRVKILLDQAPGLVNVQHPFGGTAMHAAARFGHGDRIWILQGYGGDADLASVDSSLSDDPNGVSGSASGSETAAAASGGGVTPTRIAFDHPDLPTAERTVFSLISNGADPNAPQRDGDSLLHAAARRNSPYLVRMLIRKGGRTDALDKEGQTPLDVAKAFGSRESADWLQRASSIPRDHRTSRFAYDASGSPFSFPVDLEASAISRVLINSMVGVSHFKIEETKALAKSHPELIMAVSTSDEMTIEACAHTGRLELVEFFLDEGAPLSLPTSLTTGRFDRARALLREDPLRVHERGAHDFFLGWYPAIGGGKVEGAELLVEYGLDVNGESKFGQTPLHAAVQRGHTDLIDFWLENGAEVNARTLHRGLTPLDLAVARKQEAAVALLRSRGGKSGEELGAM